MTTATPTKPQPKRRPTTMTVERFERHPGLKGYELVEGHLERKGMGAKSSSINHLIGMLLGLYVRTNQLGYVFESECIYRCFPGLPRTIRKPDVSFVKNGRFPNNQIPKGVIEIAPDFVVEVMSVHDRWSRVNKKVQELLAAGVPLVWVVDPGTITVHIYLPDGSSTRHGVGETVSADPAVPGFRVAVAELFPIVEPN
jgi:Uma2 family endonuclease